MTEPIDAMSYRDASELSALRAFVRARALALGLAAARTDMLTLAVSELATNTLLHTNGGGRVRVWVDTDQVVCEVVDRGPLRAFGRSMPPADSVGGRGLAIVERVCDEVTTSAVTEGTLVRLRLNL
jgi:anti-sigma regulatory factor (Ser/Thr protein kinase)